MDGDVCLSGRPAPMAAGPAAIARAHAPAHAPDLVARLARDLGAEPAALTLVFASPEADLGALAAGLPAALGGAPMIGCTTAGEIGPEGYAEGQVVALALPRGRFAARVVALDGLAALDAADATRRVAGAAAGLAAEAPGLPHAFAVLLIDGLSAAEDAVAGAVARGLDLAAPGTPLVGGSAGDGERYGRTLVAAGGRARSDAAAVALVRSAGPVRAVHADHLGATARRVVVTGADPAARVVTEIDAEPAAREYARLLGLAVGDLGPAAFALNPLVVRVGARHHVRAIQRVEGEHLRFFSAIDEGLVMRLAETRDLAGHLDRQLAALGAGGRPEAVLTFDCLLRRIEARERQVIGRMGAALARHGALGFSTYGEQHGAMHVNQTFTGVALYPPGVGAR